MFGFIMNVSRSQSGDRYVKHENNPTCTVVDVDGRVHHIVPYH